MHIVIENGIKKLKFEEIDTIPSPEKVHILRTSNSDAPVTYYLNEGDYLKKNVFEKERALYKDPSNDDLRYNLHIARKRLEEYQGSSLRTAIANISEDSIKLEVLKYREKAKLKPENYTPSPDRPHTHVKLEGDKKTVLYFSDEEIKARESAIALHKKLCGSSSVSTETVRPREVVELENEISLYRRYTSSTDTAFYFLVDLANIIGITSGRSTLGVDCYDLYNEITQFRLSETNGEISSIITSEPFKNDMRILSNYSSSIRGSKLHEQTFKNFSLLWIERRLCKTLDILQKLELYELVLENLGRSPISKINI